MRLHFYFVIFLTLQLFIAAAQNNYSAGPYDIVIDEIMADPLPPAGLPSVEYIELKNRTSRVINLAGWKLSTSSTRSGATPSYELPPGGFVLLTTSTGNSLFQVSSIALPGFPTLPNQGTVLSLISKEGKTIHALAYSDEWYGSEVKKEGGWSLEMIDCNNPCSGSDNWKASGDPSGGTPGRINSVNASNPDESPPRLLRTYSPDSLTITAVFNESLDSSTAAQASNYLFDNNQGILSVRAIPPLFNQVQIRVSSPVFQQGLLTVHHVTDCSGNHVGIYNQVKFGKAVNPVPGSIEISEVLFNPKPGCPDYVELFNSSALIIDAAGLFLANRNVLGEIASVKRISDTPFYIFPGDFALVTEDLHSLSHFYLVKNPDQVFVLPTLPSYPDDHGTVVLLDRKDSVLDEVPYDEKWHFPLITNPEGVSLERLDMKGKSAYRGNWHSAAATAGYGTPGYQNSQSATGDEASEINISPQICSPDNDGRDDMVTISYHLAESGYVANIRIFDAGGRLVCSPVKNELLGHSGFWTWDGLGEKKNILPGGIYIVFTELFNLEGKKKQFKHSIVLTHK